MFFLSSSLDLEVLQKGELHPMQRGNKLSNFFDTAEYIAFRVFRLLGILIGVILLLSLDVSGLIAHLRTWFPSMQ